MNFQKLIDYFRDTPKNTASVAKERLQIVISHERAKRQNQHDFLPLLQKELMAVISKYFPVEEDQVRVELAKTGDLSILELNITLPDKESGARTASVTATGRRTAIS